MRGVEGRAGEGRTWQGRTGEGEEGREGGGEGRGGEGTAPPYLFLQFNQLQQKYRRYRYLKSIAPAILTTLALINIDLDEL
jgi:hypothetical protein